MPSLVCLLPIKSSPSLTCSTTTRRPPGRGRAFGLVVTVCKPALFCCLTQGLQGGLGMKGEKGIPGFPGPRVSVRNISVNFSLHSA